MKTLTTLGVILSTLGFIYLVELQQTSPATAWPLTIGISLVYLIGVTVEYRNKR